MPDIDCNRYIKFDLLQRYALETLRADAVATGHFVRNTKSSFLEPQGSVGEGAKTFYNQKGHFFPSCKKR